MNTTEIDWSQNCLTDSVHGGRDGDIWHIPLLYASMVIPSDALEEIVISRIYNDAMQIVGISEIRTEQWAEHVKQHAEKRYRRTLNSKLAELRNYYASPSWKLDMQRAGMYVTRDILNPGYAPLHNHDTVNLLCRILGMTARMNADKELAQK